jgi:hypothetical protein
MKVKCVSNESWDLLHNLRDKLTIGKIYDVIKIEDIPFSPHRYDDPSGPFYRIKCDNGEIKHIDANRFRELTLDEKRELKLEDLGI